MSKVIDVKLTPKASANRVGDLRQLPNGNKQLSIYVTAPPDNNKANSAMLRLLVKHLNIPVSALTIIRGHTSRNKVISINI